MSAADQEALLDGAIAEAHQWLQRLADTTQPPETWPAWTDAGDAWWVDVIERLSRRRCVHLLARPCPSLGMEWEEQLVCMACWHGRTAPVPVSCSWCRRLRFDGPATLRVVLRGSTFLGVMVHPGCAVEMGAP